MVTAVETLRGNWGWFVALGIVAVLFGTLAIAVPLLAGIAVTTFLAFLIIAGGLAEAFFAFQSRTWGKGLLRLLIGLLAVAAGTLVLTRPLVGVLTLTALLAIYIACDGVMRTLIARLGVFDSVPVICRRKEDSRLGGRPRPPDPMETKYGVDIKLAYWPKSSQRGAYNSNTYQQSQLQCPVLPIGFSSNWNPFLR